MSSIRLPHYAIEVFWSAEDQGNIARLVEVPSLSAFGSSEEIAIRELKRATRAWLKVLADEGKEPPAPLAEREFSGAFRLRVPKDLHRQLAVEAQRNRVSLNTYCVRKLSCGR
jgi:predicted HicB family RNase H-like nuclease